MFLTARWFGLVWSGGGFWGFVFGLCIWSLVVLW